MDTNTISQTSSFFRSIATVLRKNTWLGIPLHGLIRLSRPKYTMGAVGVLFNARGQVLLVEHVFHPKTPWGLPGGWANRSNELLAYGWYDPDDMPRVLKFHYLAIQQARQWI